MNTHRATTPLSPSRTLHTSASPRRGVMIGGVDFVVHWTLGLFLVWLFTQSLVDGEGLPAAIASSELLVALFVCGLLHELGHAAVGRRFGVHTRSITLYPTGGVARLDRIPREPRQELFIALAGPAVNLVIASALLPFVNFSALAAAEGLKLQGGPTVAKLIAINLTLGLFNLIPAFPMDGGRVFRALLATMQGYVKATRTAASVGKVFAIGFALVGLMTNWMLLFIAVFVYVAGQGELMAVEARQVLRGIRVRDIMTTGFVSLSPTDPVATAANVLLKSPNIDFPVVSRGQPVGILGRRELMLALARHQSGLQIADVMRSDCGAVRDTDTMDEVQTRLAQTNCHALPVVADGQIVGLVTLDGIGQWLMSHHAAGDHSVLST